MFISDHIKYFYLIIEMLIPNHEMKKFIKNRNIIKKEKCWDKIVEGRFQGMDFGEQKIFSNLNYVLRI